ncbi:PAS domain S-box protein [Halalkalirubrum salinum]|uniref:PAS domain S-box protein n=1 Tax=Halalkalirubrum salinum TaxID=2563889 RepID=UPI0010FB3A24|nr:PAS domain S-box protein [Halalkalirubrum salinum]
MQVANSQNDPCAFRFDLRHTEAVWGPIEDYNETVVEWLGYDSTELVGEPLESVVAPVEAMDADNLYSIQTAGGDRVWACEVTPPAADQPVEGTETRVYLLLAGGSDQESTVTTPHASTSIESTTQAATVHSNRTPNTAVLEMTAAMNEADSVEQAAEVALGTVDELCNRPGAALWRHDPATERFERYPKSDATVDRTAGPTDRSPDSVVGDVYEAGDPKLIDYTADSDRTPDSEATVQRELLVPIDEFGVMSVDAPGQESLTDNSRETIVRVAAAFETAVTRIANNARLKTKSDVSQRLYEIVTSDMGFDETLEALLSLGCEHLSLDTGVVSRIKGDGDTHRVETVVTETDRITDEAVHQFAETLCPMVTEANAAGPVAIADLEDIDCLDRAALAEGANTYVGYPLIVEEEIYGAVCFCGAATFETENDLINTEFVSAIGGWIGNEIEQQTRYRELRRYETILEAVGDPVYALDTDGRFTYVNQAAKEDFGYGQEIIGQHVSVGMDLEDVAQISDEIHKLASDDRRTLSTEFTLRDADGEERIVENSLALIRDDGVTGSAGILRDVTEQRRQNRRLKSFKQAIETASEGIAILDGDTYVYVDQTHADIYGFEDRSDLLGDTWQKLYRSNEQIAWFESEVFPVLAAEGRWSGRITSERPDGAELTVWLSLTVLRDNRLLCIVRDETERVARERERQRNERRFESVFNDPQSLMASVETDGSIIQLNKAAREYLCQDGDVAGVALWDLEWFADKPEFQKDAQARIRRSAAGEYIDWEQSFEDENGQTIHLSGTIRPVTDDNGTVESLIISGRDVTGRERRRRELESFQQAIESAEDGVAVLEEDEYVFIDQTHVDMYGFESTEQLLGKTWKKLYDKAEVERLEAEAFPALSSEGYWRGDVTGTRPDGSTFPAELSLTIVEDGRLVCTVRDESEKKERERELQLKEQAMDAASVGIQITDPTKPNNPLVYVNDGFERITGYEKAEVLGKNPRFLQGTDTKDASLDAIRKAIEAQRSVTLELQNKRKDGTAYWNRLSITPVFDNGTLVNYIGIQQDVTERYRRIETLEDRQRRLDLTLSGTGTGIIEIEMKTGAVTTDDSLEDVFNTELQSFNDVLKSLHPADRSKLATAFDSLKNDIDTWSGEARITATETTRWVAIRAIAVEGVDDSDRILATVTDISERKQREAQLYEERERFRMLVDAVDEYAFVVFDTDGAIAAWNDSAERLFGYDRETAIGMPMEVLHPADEQANDVPNRLLEQARISGESADSGKRVRADGTTFPADVRYAPIENDSGAFRGYAMICRDLTDQRERERRTQRFVEESIDVVSVLEKDGSIEYVSPVIERVLAYRSDELLGENLFDLIHTEDRTAAMDAFFSTVSDPEAHSQIECRARASDGTWRTLDVRMFNYEDDSAIGGMLLYLRDVTEQKRQERRFEGIFQQASQFIGLLDANGRFLEVNESLTEHTAESIDEVIEQTFSTLSWWDHDQEAKQWATKAVRTAAGGEFVRYETAILTPSGLITVDMAISPVADETGNVDLLILEVRDITQKHRRRQYLQALQRIMRHNIRNDLTKARGYAEMIADRVDDEQTATAVDVLTDVFDTWDSMTEKTREIQRLLSDDDAFSRSAVTPLMASTLEEVARLHPEATVALTETQSEAVVSSTVRAALIELIDNAIAASPTNEVSLTVSSDDDWVDFEVADNGPGLPEMEASVLEEGEETPLNHGQGVGLWLVRMVVTGSGGEVNVRENDRGTVIELRLPNCYAQSPQLARSSQGEL